MSHDTADTTRAYRPASSTGRSPALEVRAARPDDLPGLERLERSRWADGQAAKPQDFLQRMAAFPRLSLVAVRRSPGHTTSGQATSGHATSGDDPQEPAPGEIVASMFTRPITTTQVLTGRTWADCTDAPVADDSDALFGISFTSVEPSAVGPLILTLGEQAREAGWRRFYLGSLVPGLRGWIGQHPGRTPEDYIRASAPDGLPLDPLLRYYHRLGLHRLDAVRPGYFPDAGSLGYGVLISGDIPFILGLAAQADEPTDPAASPADRDAGTLL